MLKKITLAIMSVLVLLQFIPVDRPYEDLNESNDFLVISRASEDIKNMVRHSCYDCHSNQTQYPWYAYLAPISFLISHDVKEGKEHLNFSEWGSYSQGKRAHKLEECTEEIEEGEMPLKIYLPLHPEANFSNEERKKLIDFFDNLIRS